MPHIATSMQRSVRRGVGEIFFDSLLGKRGITDEVNNVKDSFSSWDNCMNATYCKWPVIAAIIIGGLILLSVVTCIGRVCCCGASCCCSCFSFLKCCDCCGDSCAGKKDKPMKHKDSPFHPTQGYQAPAPMMGGALPAAGSPMNVASTQPTPPQYAQFEVGKNGLYVEPKVVPLNDDALPPMPSWDAASKKHIPEEEKNAVELGELDPATGQKMPLMAAAAIAGSSVPPSPDVGQGHSPYGARPGAGNNGYMGVAGDHQGQSQAAFNGNGRYGSPAPGQDRGGYGGRSPQGYDGQGRGFAQDVYDAPEAYDNQGRGYGSPAPQDPYAQNNGFDGGAAGGFGRQPQGQYPNDQYSDNGRPFPPPNRQYSSDSSRPLGPGRQYTDRSYGSDNMQGGGPPRGPSRGPGPNGPPRGPSRGPGPNDQYGPPRGPSRGPGGPMRTGSPALNNNSGFDFGGGAPSYQSRQSPPPQQGYGRPPPRTENSDYFGNVGTAAPSYASRSSPPQEPAYPGYKAYQPGNQDRGIPQALSPGEGRGREPQRWDPVQQ
ncbi:hypothetical protein BKA64DRAFT_482572 [Cadophora sp. MPI-SDFR-AT-0126]|nr:hypothetical protein BKA64DRAFT_482572 [Leotiomycetes sp. MPI-SDFR-AT-0126]